MRQGLWFGIASCTFLLVIGCASDPWKRSGFTAEEAVEWRSTFHGKEPLKTAIKWRTAGFSHYEMVRYRSSLGWSEGTPEVASSWKKAGFDSRDVFDWIGRYRTTNGKRKPFTLDEAIRWKAARLSSVEARKWKDAGATPDEETVRWVKDFAVVFGLSPEKTLKWKKAGFTLGEAKIWRKGNFNGYYAGKWKNAGFTLDEAREWKTAGFTSVEAREWKAALFTSIEARNWRNARLNWNTANEWKNSGFAAVEAKKWELLGFTAEDAKVKHKRIKAVCPNAMGSPSELFKINPYDVKGRCFQFRGTLLQLLGRTFGLYTYSSEAGEGTVYINFSPNSAAMGSFADFVKGEGAFEYTAALGQAKVIPKLHIVR